MRRCSQFRSTIHPFYSNIRSYTDLPPVLIGQISHFFEHYKELEKGQWVKVLRWQDAGAAQALVREAIDRALRKT
jgi:inorganic pyrophosphatase